MTPLTPSVLLAMLRKHLRIVLIMPMVFAIVGITLTFVFPYPYVANATFRPRSLEAGSNKIAGLAAQFGVAFPVSMGGDPIRLYAELLNSRSVLTPVLLSDYVLTDQATTRHGTLLDFLQARGKTPHDRLLHGINLLRSRVTILPNREAGIIELRAATKWPLLSELIVRRIVDQLDAATAQNRRTSASAERKFVEQRTTQARYDLDTAEAALRKFSESNRSYRGSPALATEFNRLQRRVDLYQQIYVGLAQTYEQARIEEVRNTPSIAIIDSPEGSSHRVGSRGKDAVVWLIIGLTVAVLIVIAKEYGAEHRTVVA